MFNPSQPAKDRSLFLDKSSAYLQCIGRYSTDEATAVATTLLRPALPTIGQPLSLPERQHADRRRFNWMWALLTKGTAPNDGIGPHTDSLTDFPYLGTPRMDASAESHRRL